MAMMAEPQVVHKPQERMKEGHILQESSDCPYGRYLKNVRALFAEKWYDIGLELLEPVDEPNLRIIKSNRLGKVESCAEMLELWIDRQPNATWNQLIKALKAPGIELHSVAAKIGNMLIRPNKGSSLVATQYLQQSPVSTLQNELTFASNDNIQLAFIRLSKLVQQAISHTDLTTIKQASLEIT
ncbi:uncharacterized protein [Dysidea avara]|uniref:uncharacterized protein n=1 Tax=Dysidea avara TaxID=196820 RepID=UPI00332F0575